MRRLTVAWVALVVSVGCTRPRGAGPTLTGVLDPARTPQIRIDDLGTPRRLRVPIPLAALPAHVRVAAEAADPGAAVVEVTRERDTRGFGYAVTMRTGTLTRTWRFDDAGRRLGWWREVPLEDLPPAVTARLVRVRPEARAERAVAHHDRDGRVLGYEVLVRDAGGAWTLWIPRAQAPVRIWQRLDAVLEIPAQSPASRPASSAQPG